MVWGMRAWFFLSGLVVALAFAVAPGPAHALEGPRWLCEGEKTTGFRFDAETGDWREAGFPAEEMKWVFATRQVIDYGALARERAEAAGQPGSGGDEPESGAAERADPPMKLIYSFKEYGKDWPVLQCDAREVFSTLQCEFGAYAFASKFIFRLNTVTNRFMLVSPNGYVEGPDESGAAPTITIGECRLF